MNAEQVFFLDELFGTSQPATVSLLPNAANELLLHLELKIVFLLTQTAFNCTTRFNNFTNPFKTAQLFAFLCRTEH